MTNDLNLSNGFTLSDFSGEGKPNIGQFSASDLRKLDRMVRKGKLKKDAPFGFFSVELLPEGCFELKHKNLSPEFINQAIKFLKQLKTELKNEN